LEDLLKPFLNLAKEPSWRIALDAADVLLVAYVIYRVLSLIRGTRAWRIVLGLGVFAVLIMLSSAFHLETLHWLLDKAALLAPVALVILFLPELRQTLEGVGKLGLWTQKLVVGTETSIEAQSIEEIVAASAEMSASRVGALIVLEQSAPLSEIISNGVQLEAKLSAPLLGSIFYTGNPLHDGAVVVRGNTIVAAACRLPLSESSKLDSTYHMRHRAAIGLSEQQNCLVVVISEERGSISVVSDAKLQKLSGPSELRDVLNQQLRQSNPPPLNGQKKKMFAKAKQTR
jgi:diadenylate cyclase